MDPLTKLELFWAKYALYIIGVLILVIAIVGWLGYNSWRNSQNVANREDAQKTTTKATGTVGQVSGNVIQHNADQSNDTDKKTGGLVQNFYTNKNTLAPIDPSVLVDFNKSICMYRSASELPECREMQQLHSGQVENRQN